MAQQVKDPVMVTAVALVVIAVAWTQSLAQELPHAVSMDQKKE